MLAKILAGGLVAFAVATVGIYFASSNHAGCTPCGSKAPAHVATGATVSEASTFEAIESECCTAGAACCEVQAPCCEK